jgi:hypothetical protein
VHDTNVAKVDLDVTYVAMDIRLLQVSIQNVSSTSDICCRCFYLDVAIVYSKCFIYFKRMLQKVVSCCKCFVNRRRHRRSSVYMCFISI